MKATSTASAGTVPMDVSDQLQTLTCAVQYLDSSRDGGHWSMDHHTSLTNVGNAPGLGAQVICMALISQWCMLGTINVDSQDHWFGWSPMTSVGCKPRGLVLL